MSFQDVLNLLREDYGEPLTAAQVAQIFGVDRRTVKESDNSTPPNDFRGLDRHKATKNASEYIIGCTG